MNHSSHGLSAVPPPGHVDELRIEILKGNNFAWPINALAVEIPLLFKHAFNEPGHRSRAKLLAKTYLQRHMQTEHRILRTGTQKLRQIFEAAAQDISLFGFRIGQK
jgi:hypothetical protein